MTKIYLIRHAEADGNFYRRIHGQYNSRLTPRGYQQIDALAERFRNEKIDALYSSDLFRTMTTATAITRYHPELIIVPDENLREINMGCLEDLPWGNAFHYYPEAMMMFSTDPDRFLVDGAESFPHLKKRITNEVVRIAEKHDNQTIAIVTHGMAIRSLISGVFGIPSEEISRILHGDNTCVALCVLHNGSLGVEYYNDNTHLTESLSTFANQTWWKEQNDVDYSNLRIEPLNLETEAELYTSCYADAWKAAHGSLVGFAETPYLQNAKRIAQKSPEYVVKAYYGDEFAGIAELDPEMMSFVGAGWISFCYLSPEFRGRGLAPQLVGHAVSVFRRLDRTSLRLHVAQTNTRAVEFYKKLGFKHISTDKGVVCPLLLMELPL